MKNLQARILSLHPEARLTDDYIICMDPENEGEEIITFWNEDTLGPQDDKKLSSVDPNTHLAVLDAQGQLSSSDQIILRCFEAGIPVPKEWQDYRASLRKIAQTKKLPKGGLPAAPADPEGI